MLACVRVCVVCISLMCANDCICCRNHLYSSSEDKTIRVWNIHSGECVHRIEADENPISSLAHSEPLLFSGSLKTIKVRGGEGRGEGWGERKGPVGGW